MLTALAIAKFFKDNLKWIIIGFMALTIAFFVWSWGARGEEIVKLKLINETLAANIVIGKINTDLEKSATDILDKRLKERNQELEKLCKLWVKTDDKTDTDPVGLVLDGLVLDRVQ